MADNRYRNWATILYPESAVENWEEILSELKTPILISPLHDQDINPGGEKKKPHYHILFTFEGKKSREQIKEITDKIGSVGQEQVNSLRGYARYLTHKDNPEKYQYNPLEVRSYGGIDYQGICGLPSDKRRVFNEMCDFIRSNRIISFADLRDYAAEEREDWLEVIYNTGTLFIKEYIKSNYWRLQYNGIKQKRAEDLEEPYNCST